MTRRTILCSPRAGRATAILITLLLVGLTTSVRAELPTISKRVEIAASAGEVWRAFTTAAGATGFFAPDAKIELRQGGAYELYFDPKARPGSRGSEGMRVLAYLPERMLAFSWNAPPRFPRARAESGPFVVVLLEPRAAKRTQVSLHHLGFGSGGEWPGVRAYFERAWSVVLDRLARRFREGKPIDWSKL
jgi:uncharacterized protein YndB with AHSA1/START domain